MKKDKDKKDISLRISLKEAYIINIKAFKLIFGHYPQMFVSWITYVIWNALTPYVSIYMSALIIEEISTDRNPARLKSLVIITLAVTAVISLINAFLLKWKDTQCAGMFYKVNRIFANKLLDMDYVSIDDIKTHEKLSTIKQNQNGGGWGLNRVIWNYDSVISAVFTFIGGIALTVSLFVKSVPQSAGRLTVLNNPICIFVVIGVMLLVTYISPALSNKAGSYYASRAENHNLGNRLFGFFGWLGHNQEYASDVRIYRQDKICDKYNNNKTNTFGSKGVFAKVAKGPIGLYSSAASAVSVIFTGVVYIFVCLKAYAGAFGIGLVTQYISSLTKVSSSVSQLVGTVGDMRNNASFLKLVFDFLEIPNTMRQGEKTIEKSDTIDYEIEFRNVSFKYPGSDEYALKNVSMRFKAGERLAVVGENGSGKTTFIKLLCRLYDPTEGMILLNGTNITDYNYLEYLSIFSVVFQDFKLFAFTLGQNVGTTVKYDRELAEKCLRKAGFGERLDKMEEGTETYIYKEFSKKGVDISGGEAQKIALARTLYRNSPFIILDEPTAALDPIAESEVYSNFNDIVGDKSAIYISHRLSSCRFCNDIAVFHNGKLVQRGSHDRLVEDAAGKYYELWNAQAQYYNS